MTAAEYKRTSIACGLLKEDNTCGVYAARPLACRGYNSLSVQKCEEAYNHPAAPNTAPFDYHAKVWVVAIGNGMMDAQRARGLDAKGYELNSAVLCALTTPQAATKWINGQDIFKDCLIDRANQRQAPPAPQQAGPAAVRPGAAAQGTVGQGAVGQGSGPGCMWAKWANCGAERSLPLWVWKEVQEMLPAQAIRWGSCREPTAAGDPTGLGVRSLATDPVIRLRK